MNIAWRALTALFLYSTTLWHRRLVTASLKYRSWFLIIISKEDFWDCSFVICLLVTLISRANGWWSGIICFTFSITEHIAQWMCMSDYRNDGDTSKATPKWPGLWFNIKMSSYQYRKSHCGDKTVIRSSYLHNGISFTGKMPSLYWTSPPGSI